MTDAPRSYADSGVDVAAGDLAVDLMRQWVAAAQRPEAVGDLGGFAGLFDASALKGYDRPLLATATDGVGTKTAVAQLMDRYDTIGRDLVAMVADDLVVTGAEPLFLTDYIACGKVHPDRVAQIVAGIAAGCVQAGCALLGGETAEHPGLMGADDFDLAAAGTAVVEADQVLGAHRVRAGDVLVALAASGLHANGYSLARAVLIGDDPARIERSVAELGRTVGEELLEPTTIYARTCLELARGGFGVHAMAHVTGGGIVANLSRVVPAGLTAMIDRSTWRPHPIFELIAHEGGIDRAEMELAFNMGIGMILVVDPEGLAGIFSRANSFAPWILGQARPAAPTDPAPGTAKGSRSGGSVLLTGNHRR